MHIYHPNHHPNLFKPGSSSPGGAMWTGALTSVDAVLSFVPDHGAFYQPGATYAVTVRYPGMSTGMLGSSVGSWADDNCQSGPGILSTSGTWTAPLHGSVTIGGTVAGSMGNGNMQTTERLLTPQVNTAEPTPAPPPTAPPQTAPPTPPALPDPYANQRWQGTYQPHNLPDATIPDGFEFHFSWNLTETHFVIRIEAPATGWIGLGIGEAGAGAMPGGDFVVCNAQGWVSDRFALGYVTPTEDAKQDWELLASGGDGGSTFCVLKRLLATGDRQDRDLVLSVLETSVTNFMFAYSDSADFVQHGASQRTTAQVKLTNAVDQMASLYAMPDYHSNATFSSVNFRIPHDAASCTAHNAAAGQTECHSPTTTYINVYHDLRSYGTRSIIAATPDIDPVTKINLHHFVLTGYTGAINSAGECPSDTEIGPIYLWAPGAAYMILPEFLGVKLNGGDGVKCIRVNTHYDNPRMLPNLVDNSGVVLHFSPVNSVRAVEQGVYQVGDPSIGLSGQDLPAGFSKYDFECGAANFAGLESMTIFQISHHMHVAGKHMQTNLTRPGMPTVTWTVENYDFSFQTTIPVDVTFSGAQQPSFQTHCIFDSNPSQSHPFSAPSGQFGLGSNDEMCIDFFFYYPRVPMATKCNLRVTPPPPPGGPSQPFRLSGEAVVQPGNVPDGHYLHAVHPQQPGGQDLPANICVPDGANNLARLFYCSWDGMTYSIHMIQWLNGLDHRNCGLYYSADPRFTMETQPDGGSFLGGAVTVYCRNASSSGGGIGSRLVSVESLSGPEAIIRVFGTDTGTYPPTNPPTNPPNNPPTDQPCPRNCGTPSSGGGTCRANGRCLACNANKVLQSGRCYSAIACRGRRIQSGSQAGSNCRCLDDHCHYCNRAADGDSCRVCRDGRYLLDGACVESCSAGSTSLGIGSFKRRCMDPFACAAGRIVGQQLTYGCKCATDEMEPAACQNCEFRADEFGQHCTKCNGGKFLFNDRCQDSCDGTGLIAYAPGNYGRECRAPFTCTDRVDETGDACKCAQSVGRNDCSSCYYGAAGPVCSRCTNNRYLHDSACVEACPSSTAAVGANRDGRECQ